MRLIPWFGSTEKEQMENIYKEIEWFIVQLIDERWMFWTEEKVEKIRKHITDIWEELKSQDEKYEKNNYKNAPKRYTYFHKPNIASYTTNLFIGIEYRHINTKHPMSPDWIALLKERECYWFDTRRD